MAVFRPPVVVFRPPVVVFRPPVVVFRPPVVVFRPPVAVFRPPVVVFRPPVAVRKRVQQAEFRRAAACPATSVWSPRRAAVREADRAAVLAVSHTRAAAGRHRPRCTPTPRA
jgi:hypothetical protein